MKKTIAIFFLLFSIGITKAQNEKPTKEETIKYLKNELVSTANLTYYYYLENSSEYLENLSIDDCLLKIHLKRILEGNTEHAFYVTIPIDKIERIDRDEKYNFGGNVMASGIRFEVYQKDKLIIVNDSIKIKGFYLELSTYDIGESLPKETRDIDKLVKAFNHLRSLCGAPEPISFD